MSERKKIAVFCPEYFLPYSQTFVFDEIRSHERYEAEVFALGRRNAASFPWPAVHHPGGPASVGYYLATTHSRAFDSAFRKHELRLVHAHFGTSGVYAEPYATRHRLPLVVTFHGYDAALLAGRERFLPHRLPYAIRARRMFERAALLLGASEEMCELVGKLSGRPEVVRLHRLGVDVERFFRADEVRAVPRVTMIGRFVEKKGHLDGIGAFGRVVQAGQPARLTIVGSGPLEQIYRQRVRALGIESLVEFTGPLDPAGVRDVLAKTDVLLAPSRVARNGDRESGLIVVREAMAASVPVVGTRHGGIGESVESGTTGYLVAEGDVAALGAKLGELLARPETARRMGSAARRRVSECFELRAQVASLEDHYDRVLAEHATRS